MFCVVVCFLFSPPVQRVQVKDNIVRVFSKFVQEGKATIKFRDPAHDIAISKVRIIREPGLVT